MQARYVVPVVVGGLVVTASVVTAVVMVAPSDTNAQKELDHRERMLPPASTRVPLRPGTRARDCTFADEVTAAVAAQDPDALLAASRCRVEGTLAEPVDDGLVDVAHAASLDVSDPTASAEAALDLWSVGRQYGAIGGFSGADAGWTLADVAMDTLARLLATPLPDGLPGRIAEGIRFEIDAAPSAAMVAKNESVEAERRELTHPSAAPATARLASHDVWVVHMNTLAALLERPPPERPEALRTWAAQPPPIDPRVAFHVPDTDTIGRALAHDDTSRMRAEGLYVVAGVRGWQQTHDGCPDDLVVLEDVLPRGTWRGVPDGVAWDAASCTVRTRTPPDTPPNEWVLR